jgi:tetratricopeptide (TPR) repeat protein
MKNPKLSRIATALLCGATALTALLAAGFTPYYSYEYAYADDAVTPAVDGFTPEKTYFADERLNNPLDMEFADDGLLYVADSGNSRVMVYNVTPEGLELRQEVKEFTDEAGEAQKLRSPEGLCVTADLIYIADTGNNRLVILNRDFSFNRIIKDVVLTGSNVTFKPRKVSVDDSGGIYVVCSGSTEGLVQLSTEGDFLRFFGSNKVKPNPVELIYRQFLTREQRDKREQFVPTEYSNIFTDAEGFIFVSTRNVAENQIRRLNPLGNDILKSGSIDGKFGDLTVTPVNYNRVAQFEDVVVDENGFIYALDNAWGKVWVYAENGFPLFEFGGKSEAAGMFDICSAIALKDGDVYVLDSGKDCVVKYNPTDYAALILEAETLYLEGRYDETFDLWQEVLSYNPHYAGALHALADAYYQNDDYSTAMKYYEQAYSQEGASESFGAMRDIWVKQNFGLVVILIVAVIILLVLFRQFVYPKLRKIKIKSELLRTILFAFNTMFHPIDGFYELKREKKKTFRAAMIILGVLLLFAILSDWLMSFWFGYADKSQINIFVTISSFVLPLFAWTVLNWALGALFDGKATMVQIWVQSIYSLVPYLLSLPIITLLSHVVTHDEAAFISVISTFAVIWCALLFIMGNMTINDYTMAKTLVMGVSTFLAIGAAIFVGIIIFSTFQQLASFIATVLVELQYR